MPVVLIHDGHCYQFDNDTDAARFAELNPDAGELSTAEIEAVFGDDVRHVGPHNTTVDDDGSITFSYTPPGAEELAAAEHASAIRRLSEIDAATVRPMRAVLAAQGGGVEPNQEDLDMLTALEAEAVSLRATLRG